MKKENKDQSQKAKLVNIFNSSILFIFGILFLIFGFQKGFENTEGWMMIGFGILFLIFGSFRTYIIVHLMKEVEG